MEKVRCADCGFFAVRRRAQNVFDEASIHVRKTCQLGDLMTATDGSGELVIPMNIAGDCRAECFVMVEDFDGLDGEALRAEIEKPRECQRFFPWRQGYSPKEHRQLQYDLTLLEMGERRDRFEAEQRERDRRWMLKTSVINAVLSGAVGGGLGLLASLLVYLLTRK